MHPNSFLIRNEETDTCLANDPDRRKYPPFEKYNHTVLYRVVSEPCNQSSPAQRWQWNDTSLLHSATFLCLATFKTANNSLVLRTCKASDEDQKWECSLVGNFIIQPSTEKCVTVVADKRERAKRGSYLDGIATAAAAKVRRRKSLVQNQLADDVLKGSNSVSELTRELESVIEELGLLRKQATLDANSEVDGGYMNAWEMMTTGPAESRGVMAEHCDDSNPNQMWSIMDFNCEGPAIDNTDDDSICSELVLESHRQSQCYVMDMHHLSSLKSSVEKWAECTSAGYYIKGFYHTYNVNNNNHPDSGIISGVRCCAGDHVYTGESNTPVVNHAADQCLDENWWKTSDYLVSRGWFICPPGMFLKGLQLSSRPYFSQENVIKKGRCCKPEGASVAYVHCYTTNATSVADTGVHMCHLDGFLVTQIVRFNCDVARRMCEEEIRCCLPA